MSVFTLPVKKKLVDDDAAKKLQQQFEKVKQSYQPQQGWLDDEDNKVERKVG